MTNDDWLDIEDTTNYREMTKEEAKQEIKRLDKILKKRGRKLPDWAKKSN